VKAAIYPGVKWKGKKNFMKNASEILWLVALRKVKGAVI